MKKELLTSLADILKKLNDVYTSFWRQNLLRAEKFLVLIIEVQLLIYWTNFSLCSVTFMNIKKFVFDRVLSRQIVVTPCVTFVLKN